MITATQIEAWNHRLRPYSAGEILSWSIESFSDQVVFASSFGLEDQIIAQIIHDLQLPIVVVTLDTGRLFEETHQLIQTTRDKFGLEIRHVVPDPEELDKHLREYGPYGLRNSPEARRACCSVRKLLPLRRALQGQRAWITGLRRDQSDSRRTVTAVAWDDALGMVKISPLWDWSSAMLRAFVEDRETPVNSLHERGFASIGCAPCTRAIADHEDERAGRWWWENDRAAECGLHWHEGRVVANPFAV